jgi:hypothetical protein
LTLDYLASDALSRSDGQTPERPWDRPNRASMVRVVTGSEPVKEERPADSSETSETERFGGLTHQVGSLHHRHDAGPDRLGQIGPGGHDGG